MKKVRFNATTSVMMLPDSQFPEYNKEMADLKNNDYKRYQEKLLQGDPYPTVDVKADEVLDIPDWYYEAYKTRTVTVPVSFDKYKDDRSGLRSPFNNKEALRHGDIANETETMKTVKLFELTK